MGVVLDRALLSVGLGLWGIVLLFAAGILIHLVIRAKALGELREALAADAVRVSVEFEILTGEGQAVCADGNEEVGEATSDEEDEEVVAQPGHFLRRVRRQSRRARSLAVEAVTIPPRTGLFPSTTGLASAPGGKLRFAAGMSPTEIEEACPVSVAKEDHGSCSICLDDVPSGCSVRFLPCNASAGCPAIFHAGCVGLWLPRAGRCPQCQTEVLQNETKAK